MLRSIMSTKQDTDPDQNTPFIKRFKLNSKKVFKYDCSKLENSKLENVSTFGTKDKYLESVSQKHQKSIEARIVK